MGQSAPGLDAGMKYLRKFRTLGEVIDYTRQLERRLAATEKSLEIWKSAAKRANLKRCQCQ